MGWVGGRKKMNRASAVDVLSPLHRLLSQARAHGERERRRREHTYSHLHEHHRYEYTHTRAHANGLNGASSSFFFPVLAFSLSRLHIASCGWLRLFSLHDGWSGFRAGERRRLAAPHRITVHMSSVLPKRIPYERGGNQKEQQKTKTSRKEKPPTHIMGCTPSLHLRRTVWILFFFLPLLCVRPSAWLVPDGMGWISAHAAQAQTQSQSHFFFFPPCVTGACFALVRGRCFFPVLFRIDDLRVDTTLIMDWIILYCIVLCIPSCGPGVPCCFSSQMPCDRSNRTSQTPCSMAQIVEVR
ncbi:hypothetical protein F4861DRAFT_332158 [Xylaria intraflava]|nr:hypothetical protein F4861DRAFT_332158 [Xylaria intraflava]